MAVKFSFQTSIPTASPRLLPGPMKLGELTRLATSRCGASSVATTARYGSRTQALIRLGFIALTMGSWLVAFARDLRRMRLLFRRMNIFCWLEIRVPGMLRLFGRKESRGQRFLRSFRLGFLLTTSWLKLFTKNRNLREKNSSVVAAGFFRYCWVFEGCFAKSGCLVVVFDGVIVVECVVEMVF